MTMNSLSYATPQPPGITDSARARATAKNRPPAAGHRPLPFPQPFATGCNARKRPGSEAGANATTPLLATNLDPFGRQFAPPDNTMLHFCGLATPFYTPRDPFCTVNQPRAASREQSRCAPPPARPQRPAFSPITRKSAPSPGHLPQDPPPPAPAAALSGANAQPASRVPAVAIRRASPTRPRRRRQFQPPPSRKFALSRVGSRPIETAATPFRQDGGTQIRNLSRPFAPPPVLRGSSPHDRPRPLSPVSQPDLNANDPSPQRKPLDAAGEDRYNPIAANASGRRMTIAFHPAC